MPRCHFVMLDGRFVIQGIKREILKSDNARLGWGFCRFESSKYFTSGHKARQHYDLTGRIA